MSSPRHKCIFAETQVYLRRDKVMSRRRHYGKGWIFSGEGRLKFYEVCIKSGERCVRFYEVCIKSGERCVRFRKVCVVLGQVTKNTADTYESAGGV